MTPLAKREAVGLMTTGRGLSVTRACGAVRLSRAAYYRPTASRALTTDAPVIDALHGVGGARPRWGFWNCFDRLRLLGYAWNHKRVQHPLAAPAQPNHTWALDFMSDTLYDGRHFRTLNVMRAIGKHARSRSACRCLVCA